MARLLEEIHPGEILLEDFMKPMDISARQLAAEEKVRHEALREAAQVGIADIEAGRFVTFDSSDDLQRHLASVTDTALGKKGSIPRTR